MKVKFEEEKMKMVMAKDSADDFLSDEKLNLTILKQVRRSKRRTKKKQRRQCWWSKLAHQRW
ncbi:hypothetical protein AHAS_Ahas04G0163400 [Arachis hypogaea]